MTETQPWLGDINQDQAHAILNEFCSFLFRPAFGAQSKREIELKVFELLYGERLAAGAMTLGDIAEQLGVPRTRAKALVLETRSRRMASATSDEREAILRDAVLQWPANGLEADDKSFKVLVEDPFVRDILKTYAYRRGVVLDGSFSSDIIVLKWPGYETLLFNLAEPTDTNIERYADAARKRLVSDDKQGKQFAKDLEKLRKANRTPQERRADYIATVKKWAPILAGIAGTVATLI